MAELALDMTGLVSIVLFGFSSDVELCLPVFDIDFLVDVTNSS